MPFIDMISEKDKNDSFFKNGKLDELEKVEKMNISDSEKRKKICGTKATSDRPEK